MRFSYYKIFKRNFSYQTHFMEENIRFIQILDELKAQGQITDYVQAASILGTNKAGISDIKSGRKKLSIELLRSLKYSYPNISIDWIIMGTGDAFITMKEKQETTDAHLFVQTITQQAEEIGRLKEQIRQMNLEKGKPASDAYTSGDANVGVNELYDGSYTLFDNNAVSIADDGEIIVSGPCVMKGYYNDMESTENVLKDGMYHTGDYGRINNAGRLVLLQRNPDIILLPTGEKISRVRTNEQITAINGVAEGFIIFYNNRLTAVIVPIDKSATEDIFKRRIDKYNEKKGYRWEIQKIVLRKEPLPRKSDGTVDEEAVCEFISD